MIDSGLAAAIAAAALLGFRHGIDYDHVAAIADLTGSARRPAQAVGLAITYGLGHAAIVTLLGGIAIAFGAVLPRGADRIVESAVGCTLVVLGTYVLSAIASGRPGVRPATRFEMLSRAARRIGVWFGIASAAPRHDAASAAPTAGGAFGVGIIHGIGAETPTQLGLFVLSAGVGGWGGGLLCVGTFAAGLLAMNALMAFASAGVFHLSSHRERFYRAVMLVTGAYSVAIGVVFILGGFGLPVPL
jgi:hypothetical protein